MGYRRIACLVDFFMGFHMSNSMNHKIAIELSDDALLLLQSAQLLLRRIWGTGRMPSYADTIEWILAGFPQNEIRREFDEQRASIAAPQIKAIESICNQE